MLIETEEVVLMNENEDYAETLIGGIWINFKESIPAPQATILTRAFNLIYLCDQDTVLPNMINEVLIDETFDTPTQKLNLFALFINVLADYLDKMGVEVNRDNLDLNVLEELCNIVSFFYDMQGYEDVIGLVSLLESQDIPPIERFLSAMNSYLGENVSMDPYENLIVDVSEVTIFTIRDGLKGNDPGMEIPPSIIKRIRANYELLQDTVAYKHLNHQGGVGSSVETLMSFFKKEIESLLASGATADQVKYAKEVFAIYLISELNSDRIVDAAYTYLNPIITDHFAVIGMDNIMNKLDLS